jgi:hypothetical protein
VWWITPAIPALKRQRQENHQFKVTLGYTARPCLKTNNKHISLIEKDLKKKKNKP